MPNSFEIMSVKPSVGLGDFRKCEYVSQANSMHPEQCIESYPHHVSHPGLHCRTPMDMLGRIALCSDPPYNNSAYPIELRINPRPSKAMHRRHSIEPGFVVELLRIREGQPNHFPDTLGS